MIEIKIKPINDFLLPTLRRKVVDERQGIEVVTGKLHNNTTDIYGFVFGDNWLQEDAEQWVKDHGSYAYNELGENEIINLSKGDSVMKTKVTKVLTCHLKDFNDEDRSFTAIASTSSIDRDGDILVAKGVVLKNFRKNPSFLWSHNANALPIGRAEDVKVEGEEISFRPKFATLEMNPFAEQVYLMYKSKFLNAFSIRFDPITFENMPDDAKSTRFPGRKYIKWEMLEISAVNVPSNAEALQQKEYHNFIVKSAMYDAGVKDVRIINSKENLSEKESRIEGLKNQISEFENEDVKEKKLDKEIKTLEDRVEVYTLTQKVERLNKEVRDGITALDKRR